MDDLNDRDQYTKGMLSTEATKYTKYNKILSITKKHQYTKYQALTKKFNHTNGMLATEATRPHRHEIVVPGEQVLVPGTERAIARNQGPMGPRGEEITHLRGASPREGAPSQPALNR